MKSCYFIKECSYINETVKYEESYRDVMKSNFCRYYYRNCAIWKAGIKEDSKGAPRNLLPFQHKIIERIRR